MIKQVADMCLIKRLVRMQLGLVDRLKISTYPDQQWKEVVKGLQPGRGREEYEEILRAQGGMEALLDEEEWRERTEERLGALREMF